MKSIILPLIVLLLTQSPGSDLASRTIPVTGTEFHQSILLQSGPQHNLRPDPIVLPNQGLPLTQNRADKDTIIISPGHGWTDQPDGEWTLQRHYFYGIVEDYINMDFAEDLNARLVATGFDAQSVRNLNREAGDHPSGHPWWEMNASEYVRHQGVPWPVWHGGFEGNDRDIIARPEYGNWIGADMLISIHNNGNGGRHCPFEGTETWYDISNGYRVQSQRLASYIQARLIERLRDRWDPKWCSRGSKAAVGYYGEIRRFQGPSVLLELAFMDIRDNNQAIQSKEFRTEAITAIYQGILDYYDDETLDHAPPSQPHYKNLALGHPHLPHIETLHHLKFIPPDWADLKPDQFARRQQAAQWITWTMQDVQTYDDGYCAFRDVCPGHPFYQPIRYLKQKKLIPENRAKRRYFPNGVITRGEVAAMVVLAHDQVDLDYEDCVEIFTDVPCDHPYYLHIRRLQEGIDQREFDFSLARNEENEFEPEKLVTFGEIAELLIFGLKAERLLVRYHDVLPGHPFYYYLEALGGRDIAGCEPDPQLFCLDAPLTRADMAELFIRGLGQLPHYGQDEDAAPAEFWDVFPNHPDYVYIRRMAELGLDQGFDNGSFRPNDSLTRADFAQRLGEILVDRLNVACPEQHRLIFTDVDPSDPAYSAIQCLADLEISHGFPDQTFRPDDLITRGSAAKYVALGLIERIPASFQEDYFDDVPENDRREQAALYKIGPKGQGEFARYVVPEGDRDWVKIFVPLRTTNTDWRLPRTFQIGTLYEEPNADIAFAIFAADEEEAPLAIGQGRSQDGGSFMLWQVSEANDYYLELTNTHPFAQEGVAAHIHLQEVSCVEDLNRDQRIDLHDLREVTARWHTKLGDADYHWRVDFNGDGQITVLDVQQVAHQWQHHCDEDYEAVYRPPASITPITTLQINTPTLTLNAGEQVTVDVVASDMQNLGAFELTMRYEPDSVEVVNVAFGEILHRSERLFLPLDWKIDAEQGIVTFAGFSVGNDKQGLDGQGTLATLTLQSRQSGDAPLTLRQATLTDIARHEAIVRLKNE
ncbi:MAG: S-layer homology domain-containing protein [Chloroflexota bacterium]